MPGNPCQRPFPASRLVKTALMLFLPLATVVGAAEANTGTGLIAAVSNLNVRVEQASPIGTVVAFAGKTAPSGWLLCDGETRRTNEFPELSIVLDGVYNRPGDETGTFRTPDMRSRVVVGAGQGGGLDDQDKELPMKNLGSKFGAAQHTLTTEQIAEHKHEISDPTHSHTIWGDGEGDSKKDKGVGLKVVRNNHGGNAVIDVWGAQQNTTGITIHSTPKGQPHNITQPSFALHYIIKAKP